ncbi:MAG: hypothetical protein LUH57_02180 [Ruminococcus sp.]|nr:hypothetical protein [Ruminococcus sp.]
MTYSKGVFYTISRVILLLLINVFSSVVSTTLFAWILNLIIPSFGENSFRERLFSSGIWSVLAWCVIIVILVVLFYSDGKRHSAYGEFEGYMIFIVSVFMFAVYVIPIFFMDNARDNALLAFEGFYFPCKWLLTAFNGDYVTAVMVGIIPPIVLAAASYCIAHVVYVKHYPSLDPIIQNPNYQIDEETDDAEEADNTENNDEK